MRRLWLASGSPRRKLMLEEAGFLPRRVRFDVDDDVLVEAVGGVEAACLARAWFKACAAVSALDASPGTELPPAGRGVLLAADTLCEADGFLVGKPHDAEEATVMIRSLLERNHRTLTGVAIIDLDSGVRSIWSDATLVRIGALPDSDLESYVNSGAWSGKSGGYNLSDRIEAGWDIQFEGDPTTVMGLPMGRLVPELEKILRIEDVP